MRSLTRLPFVSLASLLGMNACYSESLEYAKESEAQDIIENNRRYAQAVCESASLYLDEPLSEFDVQGYRFYRKTLNDTFITITIQTRSQLEEIGLLDVMGDPTDTWKCNWTSHLFYEVNPCEKDRDCSFQ